MPEPYSRRPKTAADILDRVLSRLGNDLPIPVQAWDIGGAPMVYRRLKGGTKDVDLVVETEDERQAIVNALTNRDYDSYYDLPEYDGMEAVFMRKDNEVGIDVFVKRIKGKFELSEGMKGRADPHRIFGNLAIRDCSNGDLLLLKAVTNRPDDDADVLILAGTAPPVEEMKRELAFQQNLSGTPWPSIVAEALRQISRRTGVEIPLADEF